MTDKRNAMAFEETKVDLRFKLFALWSSVMFLYIYGDFSSDISLGYCRE